MIRNCQVCGNPMFSKNDMGSNEDGTFNKDFCSNCFRSGEFTADGDRRNGNQFTALIYPFTAVNGYGIGMTGTFSPGYLPPVLMKEHDEENDTGY